MERGLAGIAATILGVALLLAGGCKTKKPVKPEETFLYKEQACASGDMRSGPHCLGQFHNELSGNW